MTYRLSLALALASLSLSSACSSQIVLEATSGAGNAGTSGTGNGASPGTTSGVSSTSGGGGFGAGGTGGVTSGGSSGDGIGPFDAGPPMCNASLDDAPIMLPGVAAKLNLAGLTLPQVEQIDCPCNPAGSTTGAGGGDAGATSICALGASSEVWVDYDPTTQHVTGMTLWPGYAGTLDFKSRDGEHTYSITVNNQPSTKDGNAYSIHWPLDPASTAEFQAEISELYDGMLATYAPGIVPNPNGCVGTGGCVYGSFGDGGYVNFVGVGLTLWVTSQSQPQPVPSIWNRADLYLPLTE